MQCSRLPCFPFSHRRRRRICTCSYPPGAQPPQMAEGSQPPGQAPPSPQPQTSSPGLQLLFPLQCPQVRTPGGRGRGPVCMCLCVSVRACVRAGAGARVRACGCVGPGGGGGCPQPRGALRPASMHPPLPHVLTLQAPPPLQPQTASPDLQLLLPSPPPHPQTVDGRGVPPSRRPPLLSHRRRHRACNCSSRCSVHRFEPPAGEA